MIRRIVDITESLRGDIVTLGQEFTLASGLPGTFDEDHFLTSYCNLLQSGIAAVWVGHEEQEVAGIIGGIVTQCPFTGDVVAIESFWFVREKFRKDSLGVRLLKLFEEWAVEMGADRICLSCMNQVNPDRMGEFYVKRGYALLEHAYVRRIE